jgi:hypothetical protein
MPGRCSCAGSSCSCQITAGNGLSVTGTGNASSPYVVSLAPAQTDINHGTAGVLDLSQVGGYSSVLVTLAANATSVTLPPGGSHLDLLVVQAAGGSKTITWPAIVKFPGGTDPVLSTADGATDWITLIQAGGVWAGVRTAAALA